jgi:hypothetical protein
MAKITLKVNDVIADNIKLLAGQDIRPSADSTTAINIAQADGTDFVTFDTTNKRVGIGTNAPSALFKLDIRDSGTDYRAKVTDTRTSAYSVTSGGFLMAGVDNGSAVTTGTRLGGFTMFGVKNNISTYAYPVQIQAYASEDWTSSATGADLAFNTIATGGTSSTEKMRLTSAGNVGIGTTAPPVKLSVIKDTLPSQGITGLTSTVLISSDNPGTLAMFGLVGADNTVGGTTYNGYKARGTSAVPLITTSGDSLMQLAGYGWDTTTTSDWKFGSSINFLRGAGVGSQFRIPGEIVFRTSQTADNTIYERMRITSTGDIKIPADSKKLLFGAADDASITFDGNSLNIVANAVTGTDKLEFTYGEAVFNDAGADVDFRIEGDTEANLFYVDAGNNRIGIGTSAPQELLHVLSSTTSARAEIESTFATGAAINKYTSLQGSFSTGVAGDTNRYQIYDYIANTYRFVIDGTNGNVGIGTITPDQKLTVVDGGASTQVRGAFDTYTTAAGFGTVFALRHSNSDTIGTKTATVIDQILGTVGGYGVDSANAGFVYGGGMVLTQDGNAGASRVPVRVGFFTSPDGTTTPIERLRITSAGNIKIPADSKYLYFGAGDDASITYDGTNMLINPKAVGSGYLDIQGKTVITHNDYPGLQTIRTTTATTGLPAVMGIQARTSNDMADGFGTVFNIEIRDSAGVDNIIGSFGSLRNGADNSGNTIIRTYAAGTPSIMLEVGNNSAFTFGDGLAGQDIALTFDGETNDGVLTWMEDEDYFQFADDIMLGDSELLKLGTGVDMSVGYNGTVGRIDTSLVAASDLQIDCGTDKTLVLDESVWEDIQFPVEAGKVPAANYPTYENFTSANIEAFAFSVDDKIQLSSNEPPHGWSEGTVGSAHVHFALKSAQSTGEDRFVKLELIFAYADYNGVWTEQAAMTQEETIPTGSAQWKSFLTTFGTTVTLTGLHIGSQIKCRVRRIAATGGTEYADDVYISQVGVHVEKVRIGSRTLSAA